MEASDGGGTKAENGVGDADILGNSGGVKGDGRPGDCASGVKGPGNAASRVKKPTSVGMHLVNALFGSSCSSARAWSDDHEGLIAIVEDEADDGTGGIGVMMTDMLRGVTGVVGQEIVVMSDSDWRCMCSCNSGTPSRRLEGVVGDTHALAAAALATQLSSTSETVWCLKTLFRSDPARLTRLSSSHG
ncbi:hypothetical protein HK101_007845 [Irineochytrium annulatum]|nr:hypothetical protein HK101_007845 [Irineochytrium annulatum]